MSRFSPADVALEGFRITRERPLAVLAWIGLRLIYGCGVLLLIYGGDRGAAFTKMMALSQGQPDPAALMPLMAKLAPLFTLVLALTLVFYAVVYTAVLRSVLRPADRAYAYLRLSMDEVRQFALAVIIFVAISIYAFVLSLVSQLLIMAAGALGPAAVLVQMLVILALVGGFLYPAVRLSLAPAMTFVEGRIVLFRSLPVTDKQFTPMLGAYVLAGLLTLVVGLLAAVVFVFVVGAIGAAQGGLSNLPALFGVTQPDAMTVASFLTPIGVAKLAFNALLSTLVYIILFAPAAAIFRDLTGRAGAPAAAAVGKPSQPWG